MAGDEDMMSPYTQFDPETGFFIPIDPQTVDPQIQGHEPNSSKTTNAVTQPPASQITEEELTSSSSSSISGTQVLIISGAIFLLLAGTVFYIRRAKNKSASDVTP